MRDAPDGEMERLGTLLWVLKEACLKTGVSPARTVLEMDAIDLEIVTPAAALVGKWPTVAGDGSPSLVPLSIRATLGRAGAQIHAAYGVVGPMLLGVVALTTPRSVRAPCAEAPGYASISSVTSDLLSRGGFS